MIEAVYYGHQSSPLSAHLGTLPDELIQLILSCLTKPDLKNVALVSKAYYAYAADGLWSNVVLMDTWKLHLNDATRHLFGDRGQGECDEHDDTPIIQKLYILASNPFIASKVRVLTHRCHLPAPSIFTELPYIHFDSPNLSRHPGIRYLLKLAIHNLVNIHTLRIICGHTNITKKLLEELLDPDRPRRLPLRKLWLESCSIAGARILFHAWPSGLESVRLRRIRAEIKPDNSDGPQELRFPNYRIGRWGQPFLQHDGAGGFFWTPVEFGRMDISPQRLSMMLSPEQIAQKADDFEAGTWRELPIVSDFIAPDQFPSPPQSQPMAPKVPLLHLLQSSSTLTKLNLDWILWRPIEQGEEDDDEPASSMLEELSRRRFPNLRAFQIRNAVVSMTRLPDNIYLLESTFLDFLEAHSKIKCLAFPLDRFYSHEKQSQDVLLRGRKLVAHFSQVLIDLRLDSNYNSQNDPFSDDGLGGLRREQERIRRRRFINEFAPYMRKIEHIKLEGGIPRDEKREILRALHFCPLKRIIMIGASFPCGNTWGHLGQDLKKVDDGVGDHVYELEGEDRAAVLAYFGQTPSTPKPFEFSPSYGWRASPPLLYDVAAHHADTVEELKLCGFNGSPVLSSFLSITRPLLYPLVHLHNLRQLILSLWLVTYFEDDYRDMEIIQSWKDTRSPTSTALVVVTPPSTPSSTPAMVNPTVAPDVPNPAARPQDFNRWAVALKTRFTPSALAYRVAADFGPFLSPVAKDREGGVRVRASFCLGIREEQRSANDIFDLDIRIGRNNQVLEFVGPREEGEKGRWWDKIEGRRWF